MWFFCKKSPREYNPQKEFTDEAINLAYDISVKSYEWDLGRLEAQENGLRAIIAWFTAFYAGGTTLYYSIFNTIKSVNPSISLIHWNCYFSWSAIFYGIATLTCLWGLYSTKGYMLPSPMNLWELGYLKLNAKNFKVQTIFDAGTNYDKNRRFVANKFYKASIASIVYIVGIIFALIGLLP